MKITKVTCSHCGKSVEKPQKEVTRSIKLGRKFFCNNICSGKANTFLETMIQACIDCGKIFEIKPHGGRTQSFCSRLCANQVVRNRNTPAVIEAQRKAGLESKNLLPLHEVLKRRESWKYVELKERLQGITHEFECEIGDYIFDLVLPDLMTIIEFDGPDHKIEKQRIKDIAKDDLAASLGFKVLRKEVKRASVIPSSVLDGVVF